MLPINQPEYQPQLLEEFMRQCTEKISTDVNTKNDIFETMFSIVTNAPLAIKDLSKLTKKELDEKIDQLDFLKKIKYKNQDGTETSEGFELFNSINDHCSAIVKAIKDNRLEQKQKKNESTSEAIRSKFEAIRSKLKRGFGSPQEREIKGRYDDIIQTRLNGIKANLSAPTEEAQNLMNNVSADLLAEQLPHVPGNNIGHNSTQGGSGNNHQGPKSFTEMVDAIVKDAFNQAKEDREAAELAKLLPSTPSGLPRVIENNANGPTPPPPGPNAQNDIENGPATRALTYQPPKVEPKNTAAPSRGGAKASQNLDALVARRKQLLQKIAVARAANALEALPGEFAKGVAERRNKLAESPNNPNNRNNHKTGR